MPRILAPDPVTGPGQVLDLPRPRNVRPADQGARALIELGSTVSESGNMILRHLVEQERQAVDTRLKSRAVELWGGLENDIDAAGTVTEARAIHEDRAPKIRAQLQREAQEAGLPEVIPGLGLIGDRSTVSTRSALAKRAAGEGLDAIQAFAASQGELMVNARSEPDYIGQRTALHREITRVATSNPLLTPAAGEQLFRSTAQDAAVRRAQRGVAERADDPSALRAYAASIREGTFADLPADDRAVLAQSADDAADRAELHNLAMLDRIEARQERLADRAREQRAAELRVDLVRGELTVETLVADVGARRISNTEFDGLMQDLRTDAAQVDDPQMALILRAGAYDGSVTGVDVMTADLTQQTKEELLNIIGTRGTDSVLNRDDVKRARSHLDDVIGGVRGPLAVLDLAESERVANGLREFDARVLAGDDPWQVADQIAAQYRATPPTVTSFGRPLYLVGSPSSPDIEATARATVDAFNRGEIDQATAQRELQRLDQIERAMLDRNALHQAATTVSPRPR